MTFVKLFVLLHFVCQSFQPRSFAANLVNDDNLQNLRKPVAEESDEENDVQIGVDSKKKESVSGWKLYWHMIVCKFCSLY